MSRFIACCILATLTLSCTTNPPDTLAAIEGEAEHAYDVALIENYALLSASAQTLDAMWRDYRATAEADGASAEVLDAVDTAIAELLSVADAQPGAVAAGRSANAVSEYMPDLFELYDPTIPAEILALDYQGREIVLDGMDDDLDAADLDVEALAAIWGTVRQRVVDAGGSDGAMDFDDSVEQLRALTAGSDAQALIEEANVNLELVDVLEEVF
ncbi:MAG: hypothetical protein KC636_23925 [Myxococcales bacterium]|nr:hypothetical protein [Myxococcales bacterium]